MHLLIRRNLSPQKIDFSVAGFFVLRGGGGLGRV